MEDTKMVALEQIRQRISEAIKNSGVKQIEIARRLGISPATVSHYIHGNKMPALDTFANLCIILDVEPNDLLCIAEYKQN